MKRFVLTLVFTTLPIIFLCCGEDDPVKPGVAVNLWPDRRDKEDCVTIIKRVYDERKIEKYKELLLKPGVLLELEFATGYIWYNQQEDWPQYPKFLTYDEDVSATDSIFRSAENLTINIYSNGPDTTGYWENIANIRGVDGPNFWETRRNYDYYFDFGEDKYMGSSDVIFTIGPDPADTTKYVIYQAVDLPRGSGIYKMNILSSEKNLPTNDIFTLIDREDEKRPLDDSEETSWGAVKSLYK